MKTNSSRNTYNKRVSSSNRNKIKKNVRHENEKGNRRHWLGFLQSLSSERRRSRSSPETLEWELPSKSTTASLLWPSMVPQTFLWDRLCFALGCEFGNVHPHVWQTGSTWPEEKKTSKSEFHVKATEKRQRFKKTKTQYNSDMIFTKSRGGFLFFLFRKRNDGSW